MAKLLADEQFPFPVVRVLAVATADARAILTHDRDYIRLHKRGAVHAGMVFASEDLDSAALADRIHDALEANPVITGQLVRVYRPNNPPQVP